MRTVAWQGVNFMEKTVTLGKNEISFSIWDLGTLPLSRRRPPAPSNLFLALVSSGGSREFITMLPLVCEDAEAILFMFDLTRKSTLISVKEWFRQVREHTKTARPFLIGTKYDLFAQKEQEEQEEITKQVRSPLREPGRWWWRNVHRALHCQWPG
jgi:GTP-binding protein of the ras superfamily involved in termination of M-phase